MKQTWKNLLQVELPTQGQRDQLEQIALRRNWGLALMLAGWLHLAAFGFCYYLTIVRAYHEPLAYLLVWGAELGGLGLIFRICGGPRPSELAPSPLEIIIRRVWIGYFILAFDLGSLNTLRGHQLFEFFPAIAPLASFAFLVMTLLVSWRFFGAVLVMYVSGLFMAAHLLHAYLIFALAWWLVLNGIGWPLWQKRRRSQTRETEEPVIPLPEPAGYYPRGGV